MTDLRVGLSPAYATQLKDFNFGNSLFLPLRHFRKMAMISRQARKVSAPKLASASLLARRFASEVASAREIDPQMTPPVTSTVPGPKLTGWKRDALINVANLLGYSPRRTAAVRSTNHYYNVTSEMHDRHADFWYNRKLKAIPTCTPS